jgi:hypothetical protein
MLCIPNRLIKKDNYMVVELGLWYCKEQAEELQVTRYNTL